MKRISAAAVCLALATASAQSQQQMDSVTRAVDRVFDSFRSTDSPGCAVAVSRNGAVVLERAYGMANLETATPIQPSSIFHVASVSKQFTAAAILLLERDGKLSLDDDIRRHLPEMPDYGVPITIRHLLTHTSGLRDQWELLSIARGRFEENRITEADVMDIVPRQTALNFRPGAEYVYSNTGYTLAGVIVRRVSGKSLREFAHERMFAPLGMTSTHFHDDYTMLVRSRTSAYAPRGGAERWRVSIPNYDTYGATSLFTTVGDLLTWEANFDRPTVGDSAMVARMEVRTPLTSGDTSNYGLGVISSRYRGARVVDHTGGDAGYRSYLGRLPDHALAIAIACNAATANTTQLARGVTDAFIGSSLAPVVVPVAPVRAKVPLEQLRRRAGVYFQPTTMLIVRLVLRDTSLVVEAPGGPTLVPLDDKRFAIMGQAGDVLFADGDRANYERRIPGQRAIPFERKEAVTASRTVLSQYAGTYTSAELAGSVYRVTATDSTIELQTGTSSPFVARLAFADTFLTGANGNTVQFIRTGNRVTGFEITNGRVRRVRFTRSSAGG
jgi:CubicO group peptidase (beta-lactamase class C family)